jgi:hypothetical protein
MRIGITVKGERETALKFEQFPKQAHDRLLATITELTGTLRGLVESAEPERTGRLRGTTGSQVSQTADRIRGRVMITADFGKAGALEYGAHRAGPVKAHAARLGHVFGRLIAPMTVMVAAHTRRPNIAEHRFLRGAEAAIAEEALAEMQEALDEAVEQ